MNRTELYQLCRKAGLIVHPASPREYLIGYLMGDYDPPPISEQTHPVDRWRIGIIGMLLDYWDRIHAQLKCPARNLRHPDESKRDPRPCFGCTDTQVMACLVSNAEHDDKLKLYLPTVKGPYE